MTNAETSIAEGLARAHIALLRDLQELDEAGRPASMQNLAALRAHLEATRAHLVEHFRFEEVDGYMTAVRTREPRLERTVDELANEHGQLLSSLDALLAETATDLGLDQAMRAKVSQWINRVRQHEARENHLIQDIFNLDIGSED